MEKEITYNLEQLVSVKISDKELCNRCVYRPYKKYWFHTQKEGFVDSVWHEGDPYTKEQIEAGKYCSTQLLVIDNKAYYYPCVILRFSNDGTHSKKFKTLEEAKSWRDFIVRRMSVDKKITEAIS